MLNITIFLEKFGLIFSILLFPTGAFLLYHAIIFDPSITMEYILDKGIITDPNSMYDPEILKEVLHATGVLFLIISSIYISVQLSRKNK